MVERVVLEGVLTITALLSGVYIRAPVFFKLPYRDSGSMFTQKCFTSQKVPMRELSTFLPALFGPYENAKGLNCVWLGGWGREDIYPDGSCLSAARPTTHSPELAGEIPWCQNRGREVSGGAVVGGCSCNTDPK